MRMPTIVAFEGIDANAKETQAELLAENLGRLGYKVQRITFPRLNTPIGAVIGMWLRCEIELEESAVGKLFEADFLDFQRELSRMSKENIDFIIIDHYELSNYYYFYVKDAPLSWRLTMNDLSRRPDATFYLRSPMNEGNAMLLKVQEAYQSLGHASRRSVYTLDVDKGTELLQASILLFVHDLHVKKRERC
ncbi:dTMP kinase [Brevibacillus gelatini]